MRYIDFINYMIRLEIRPEMRPGASGVVRVCAIEGKTAIVVVASYRSVSRNPIHFKDLPRTLRALSRGFKTFYYWPTRTPL